MGMGNKGKGVYRKVGRGSLPESLGGGDLPEGGEGIWNTNWGRECHNV